MNRPTRTSYSAITTAEECNTKYYFSYIEQREYTVGAAGQRGSRLHTSAEKFLKDELPWERLPVDFHKVHNYMRMFKQIPAKSEEVWCVSGDGMVLELNHPSTFIKAIVDVHYVIDDGLHIFDLKTGKIYQDHIEQLQLYATLGLLVYPQVERVHVAGLYIDEGTEAQEATYPRSMHQHLLNHWWERANKTLMLEEFPPTVGGHCNRCSFSRGRGGPCQYA